MVTYNSGRFIKRCLESVLEQKYPNLEVVVVDNASTDGRSTFWSSSRTAAGSTTTTRISASPRRRTRPSRCRRRRWVLTLNPDVLLLPNFIQALVDAGKWIPKVGTVCGKLLTIRASFDLPEKQLVDSTGIYFTPMLRHLDRGSQEVDNGHYLNFEYVFGATAAAALYRRQMIEDISIYGEFFDPDFFVYREDADVAWRAQLMGWRCIYTPLARGYHVRNVLPGNRRALPPEINMHSVKNRFLMRIKNMTPDLYRRNWLSITARDLVVLGACLLHEHSSLKAFWYLVAQLAARLAKRQEIMRRRRAKDDYIASWFSYRAGQPAGAPAHGARSRQDPRRARIKRVSGPARAVCDPRHARHSRPLRRIRNFRRRTFHPSGRRAATP